ncbi:MAG TPA: glycosyltransferase family 4 protein [Bradyrhizobium sp.]|uniref:glycosyltransferase family 4 protein n=1 Tax=Bradyrhizobium sp. TaxID=376 RepID=UPI002D7EE939|nr:glycosyltransferase family 4 protein [Bradyrhizobium sp.]HET7888089.1 glycosyltransferase family 4 protein [Bradyrhizobium sp.]
MTGDFSEIEVVATNFNWRQSGGTTAVVQLVPEQAKTLKIAALGFDLPARVPRMRWRDVPKLFRRPAHRPFRIYHCRRNNEMIVGLVLRDVLRAPIKLIFNSAGQRRHKALTRWMLRRMDAVIATSERSGSFLEVPYTVVPHGTDFEHFHPPCEAADDYASTGLPGKYAIGCTGRIRHQKGTDLFVEAMVRLLPHYPDWTAVITGRTTSDNLAFERELKAKVAAAGLTERIIFLGDVEDIAVWYRRFTLFVAPSRQEGFGLTPLEAMASQTAVVTSDAGSFPIMIKPGLNGAIVPAGDGDALTAAIEPYLRDPQATREAGRAALEFVQANFSLAAEARGIRAVYDRLWTEGQKPLSLPRKGQPDAAEAGGGANGTRYSPYQEEPC